MTILTTMILAVTSSARAQAQTPTVIPFSDIGAKATADYMGNALSITATPNGALLRCGFQKLEGHATPEGLWLESTEPGATGKLCIVATAVRRDNKSPSSDLRSSSIPATGIVSVVDKLVRFTRPGVTEEYSVSVDGVRQDFVITQRPEGTGDLCVELALSGAQAEAVPNGARLKSEGSGRELAYNRLRAQDATGRELKARLGVLSVGRLVVTVADAGAKYPIRIDPTFSDADWVSLNPGMPGADGPIRAVVADNNGNVYVGGYFTFIGSVLANSIAKWDGSTWSALGAGVSRDGASYVYALAVSGTNLYAGGNFTSAGGVSANYIARWNGKSWSALGSGMNMNSYVYALAADGTNLYVGGDFSTAGGITARYVAKWDGSTWSALGPRNGGVVRTLVLWGNNLYAGGSSSMVDGMPVSYVTRWDGSTWSILGSGLDGSVSALAADGTNLYAGGYFSKVGEVSASNVARWDGKSWSALGSGLDFNVSALVIDGTNLYAGGWFMTAGGVPASGIARWDGNIWSPVGAGVKGYVNALTVAGSDLYVGGYFSAAGGTPANYIAKWSGGNWSALGSGMNGYVVALAASRHGLYVGGNFTSVGKAAANYVAKWDGTAWSALGSGMNGSVRTLAVSGSNLYAGGEFTLAGGVPANYVARWNGSTWSALGSGVGSGYDYLYVSALAVSGTNLYAGGNFQTAGGVWAGSIAKWDGTAWSALGEGVAGTVEAIAVDGSSLYVGGHFSHASGRAITNIARWDGTWQAMGAGIGEPYDFDSSYVYALVVSGTNLYAGGNFTSAGWVAARKIAKWDGTTWSALGSGLSAAAVLALATDGTNLYAGGAFTRAGGAPANHIAKWDGNSWEPLGSGLSSQNGMAESVAAIASDESGHLFVGGRFYFAGTNVSPYVAMAIMGTAPTISISPCSQTAEAGSVVEFALDVAGYSPITYLWYFDETNLVISSTNCWLKLSNCEYSRTGTYTVVVTNVFGAVTSAPISLNVIPPVERMPVPGLNVMGEAGSVLNLDYASSLASPTNWLALDTVSLTSTSQFCVDLTMPLPAQRFYRVWQTGISSVIPSLDLHMVPAITLTGNIGDKLRLDYINQYGPTDAWVTLDTVTLTNTLQLYFDMSSIGQPRRLYRIVPVP